MKPSMKTDVSLEEAIETMNILLDASKQEDYELKILEIGYEQRFEESEFIELKKEQLIPLEKLKFKKQSFDIVWCIDALNSAMFPKKLVSEICRVGRIGYIRLTDRNFGSLLDVESSEYPGYKYDWWLTEVIDEEIVFTSKYPEDLTGYIDPKIIQPNPSGNKYIGIYWRGKLAVKEVKYNTREEVAEDTRRYAEKFR